MKTTIEVRPVGSVGDVRLSVEAGKAVVTIAHGDMLVNISAEDFFRAVAALRMQCLPSLRSHFDPPEPDFGVDGGDIGGLIGSISPLRRPR